MGAVTGGVQSGVVALSSALDGYASVGRQAGWQAVGKPLLSPDSATHLCCLVLGTQRGPDLVLDPSKSSSLGHVGG